CRGCGARPRRRDPRPCSRRLGAGQNARRGRVSCSSSDAYPSRYTRCDRSKSALPKIGRSAATAVTEGVAAGGELVRPRDAEGDGLAERRARRAVGEDRERISRDGTVVTGALERRLDRLVAAHQRKRLIEVAVADVTR